MARKYLAACLMGLPLALSTTFGAQGNNDIKVNGYSDIITFDGPVGYYRFEETTGNKTKNFGTGGTANDGLWMVGTGPDDSAPGTASVEAGPRPPDFKGFEAANNAAKFLGPDATIWVDTQAQLLNNLPAFSLEYWVRPANRVADPTAFGTRIGIVGQNDAVEYGFIDQNTIQIWTPGGGSLNTTYSFPDNTWHHVATIATGDAIVNYFDGQLVGSGGSTAANYGSSTFNVHIGGGGVYDATGNFFTGDIDEVAIFDKAIPADRIAQHYKAGKEGAFSVPFINKPSGGINSFSIQVNDFPPIIANTNKIVLLLNGTTVKPTSVTKSGKTTTVTYVSATPFPSQSVQNTTMSIDDTTGLTYTDNGSFTVPYYATLSSSFAVTGVDTTKPGFKVKPYQVASGQPNRIAWTEEMFAGLHGANIADLTQTISGKPIGTDGYYTYTGVINWDKDGSNDGNFQDSGGYTDTVMPGQPAGDGSGSYDNDGEEVLTFVQFPAAGLYTMGVNSDDGFKVSSGTNPKDAFQGVLLGTFDVAGGRGASDSIFKFVVEKAGVYPMRLLWENGGGGANCEWFTVQPDGTKILLNDPSATNTTGIKAFYSGPAVATPAYVLSFTHGLVNGTILLTDAGTQVTDGSVKLYMNGTTVPTTGSKASGVTTVNYALAAPFAPGSTVGVSLVYKDNTSATITNSTTYVAGDYKAVTKDSVAGVSGFIFGPGGFTADGGGHTGKPGDYAIDTTAGGTTYVDVEDVGFINAAATGGAMSMSMWVKKYDIAASSAFWAQLSKVATGTDLRGFQSHIPWSNDNIYFDTMGCCDPAVQRISAGINTFADYKDDSFWTNWHHFTYTMKADQKNIYIDGKLFLNGSSSDVLAPNFAFLYLLRDGGGDYMHGLIDDFAVYSTEVTAADAAKLAGGTVPKALTGEKLVAYWSFDDAPKGDSSIKISGITSSAGNVTITWTGGGTLQTATTVNGTYTDVAGKTSPATVPATGKAGFYRIKQ